MPGYSVADGDEFIRNLWNIHEKVKAEGYTQVRSCEIQLAELC